MTATNTERADFRRGAHAAAYDLGYGDAMEARRSKRRVGFQYRLSYDCGWYDGLRARNDSLLSIGN